MLHILFLGIFLMMNLGTSLISKSGLYFPTHVPQISMQIYGGIPRDQICGNFFMITMWNPWGYFCVEISLVLPSKISKCNFNDIGRIPVM